MANELLYYVVTPRQKKVEAVFAYDSTSVFGTEGSTKTVELHEDAHLGGKADYTDQDVISASEAKLGLAAGTFALPAPQAEAAEVIAAPAAEGEGS